MKTRTVYLIGGIMKLGIGLAAAVGAVVFVVTMGDEYQYQYQKMMMPVGFLVAIAVVASISGLRHIMSALGGKKEEKQAIDDLSEKIASLSDKKPE